jgi:21S rRNA (uridine2791-2'-O)-methyltransferase
VERTKPNGRIIGIDIIPAQPPKGVTTIQGNFLSPSVQAEVKKYLNDPNRGRPRQSAEVVQADADAPQDITSATEFDGYVQLERAAGQQTDEDAVQIENANGSGDGKSTNTVDLVLSDMSAPWLQTSGFWKRSLSDPYIRMMNTSGINFRDHAGSMVSTSLRSKLLIRI